MKGFTLMELLIVVAIMVILAAVTLPIYNSFFTLAVLDSVKVEIIQNIRLAQTKALAQENDSSFGLYFEATQYTLFQGSSYSARVLSLDRIFAMPANINLSNLLEITFAKKTGLPSVSGSLILTNTANNSTETIVINAAGAIY